MISNIRDNGQVLAFLQTKGHKAGSLLTNMKLDELDHWGLNCLKALNIFVIICNNIGHKVNGCMNSNETQSMLVLMSEYMIKDCIKANFSHLGFAILSSISSNWIGNAQPWYHSEQNVLVGLTELLCNETPFVVADFHEWWLATAVIQKAIYKQDGNARRHTLCWQWTGKEEFSVYYRC